MTTTTLPRTQAVRGAACDAVNVLAFARRELRDALSSRWFLLDTIAFAVLAVAVSFISLAGTGSHGFAGFSRTTAGLLNLIMLIAPLMAILAGAGAIAGERERGTLLYLLAQPVTPFEVLLGKFIGLSVALCSCLCIGFGLSAAVLAWRAGGVGVGSFLMLVGFTCALTLVALSVGMLISTLSRKTSVAAGVGLFVWLTLVFLSDLGVMAGAVLMKLHVQELFGIAIANPLQAYKMSVILGMNACLDVLGPAGVYALQTYGGALKWMLGGVLFVWWAGAFGLAAFVFSRRSAT